MSDNLEKIIEAIRVKEEIKQPGWFDTEEIHKSCDELRKLSRNGIVHRLRRLHEQGVLDTKLVYDPERGRRIRVWRTKE